MNGIKGRLAGTISNERYRRSAGLLVLSTVFALVVSCSDVDEAAGDGTPLPTAIGSDPPGEFDRATSDLVEREVDRCIGDGDVEMRVDTERIIIEITWNDVSDDVLHNCLSRAGVRAVSPGH